MDDSTGGSCRHDNDRLDVTPRLRNNDIYDKANRASYCIQNNVSWPGLHNEGCHRRKSSHAGYAGPDLLINLPAFF